MMKKTLSTFLVLSVLVFGFGMVVFAQKEDVPQTGGDMICAVGVNCDDTVVCMGLDCPKPKIPERIRPEPIKPLPIVIDDINTCMALHCLKPSPNQQQIEQLMKAIEKWNAILNDSTASEIQKRRATDEIELLKQAIAKLKDDDSAIGIYPPAPEPPLPPACLGAYIDESGQLRNPCVERQVKESKEEKIKKHEKKVRDVASKEAKLVKESIEKSRELEKTKKELKKAAKEAKKEALEAQKATNKVIKSNNKKQRELAQKEAKKQIKEARRAAEKEKQLDKKLKDTNKDLAIKKEEIEKLRNKIREAKKELDKVKSNK